MDAKTLVSWVIKSLKRPAGSSLVAEVLGFGVLIDSGGCGLNWHQRWISDYQDCYLDLQWNKSTYYIKQNKIIIVSNVVY